jgi:hypothetical protein
VSGRDPSARTLVIPTGKDDILSYIEMMEVKIMRIRLLLASAALVTVSGTALAQTETTQTEYGIVKSWQDKNKPITSDESTAIKPATKTSPATTPPVGAYTPPGGDTNPAHKAGALVRLANGQYIPANEVKPWMKLWKDKKTAAAGAK